MPALVTCYRKIVLLCYNHQSMKLRPTFFFGTNEIQFVPLPVQQEIKAFCFTTHFTDKSYLYIGTSFPKLPLEKL